MHEGQEIVKISLRTVGEDEIDVNVEPFEQTTHKMVTLEVKKGEIVLAPEKVRGGRFLVLYVFSSFLTRSPHRRSLLSAARPNVHDHDSGGLLRRGDEQSGHDRDSSKHYSFFARFVKPGHLQGHR